MFKKIIALAAIISPPLFAAALAVFLLSSDPAVLKVCSTIGAWSLVAFVISFAYIMMASAGSGSGSGGGFWDTPSNHHHDSSGDDGDDGGCGDGGDDGGD